MEEILLWSRLLMRIYTRSRSLHREKVPARMGSYCISSFEMHPRSRRNTFQQARDVADIAQTEFPVSGILPRKIIFPRRRSPLAGRCSPHDRDSGCCQYAPGYSRDSLATDARRWNLRPRTQRMARKVRRALSAKSSWRNWISGKCPHTRV